MLPETGTRLVSEALETAVHASDRAFAAPSSEAERDRLAKLAGRVG
ncbi:MAG TPA: hypothetical protein VH063_10565 [Gaiellaceae bacterium]|nr:hypothetical protein [Gaiellaceae bacterium]